MASDAVVGSSAVEGEPTLIILCGLPGSGKSTLARRLANERPYRRVDQTAYSWLLKDKCLVPSGALAIFRMLPQVCL